MRLTLKVQELNLALETSKPHLVISNPDYFHCDGIVGNNWQLAHPQVQTNKLLRLVFTNGIDIAVQPNRLMFQGLINFKHPSKVLTPGMAHKYVESMPNMDYQRLLINFVGHVEYENQPSAPLKYLTSTLRKAPLAWLEFGKAPVQAFYQFSLQFRKKYPPVKYQSCNDAFIR